MINTRTFGFSTGAIALGDFKHALETFKHQPQLKAIELSALRTHELPGLIEALDSLDLSYYKYVSVHAPSKFSPEEEPGIVDRLQKVVFRNFPIVVHPDTIHDWDLWRGFGKALCVENMDLRKSTGCTTQSLVEIFQKRLPKASFCFDLGHIRQTDPTMIDAYFILDKFKDRFKQIHLSEVNESGKHLPLSKNSIADYQKISCWIPKDVPVIIESPIEEKYIGLELQLAMLALL
jgi:hypothetical protein